MVVLKNYLSLIRKNVFYVFLLLFLLLILFILSIQVGDEFYSFKKILNLTKSDFYIIYEIRVPRSLAAIFVGASLGIAALVMQYILKNPLASPFTLGISHGALFGASVSIIFFNS
ncbi:MAG TPA: iron ABC transporter permease, partial [Nautiliaceae bacterium]|nr:iron ABC transporter permease [Nautiliaceae bacterium]